jgi:hypothetical protein
VKRMSGVFPWLARSAPFCNPLSYCAPSELRGRGVGGIFQEEGFSKTSFTNASFPTKYSVPSIFHEIPFPA